MPLPPPLLDAVLAGRRLIAERLAGFSLPSGWPDKHDERFLRLRLAQLQADPEAEPWLVRAIILRGPRRRMIGHIGFHGPPKEGAAEMGYTIFERYRRRGFALEAAVSLMDWASSEHGVNRFIVSISPENEPSLALAAKMGFQRAGEQVDEVDGLEYVFELIRTIDSGR